MSAVITIVGALIFPTSGIIQAVATIVTMPIRGSNDLQTAAMAGALCMIVRSKIWKPRPINILSDVVIVKPTRGTISGPLISGLPISEQPVPVQSVPEQQTSEK